MGTHKKAATEGIEPHVSALHRCVQMGTDDDARLVLASTAAAGARGWRRQTSTAKLLLMVQVLVKVLVLVDVLVLVLLLVQVVAVQGRQ